MQFQKAVNTRTISPLRAVIHEKRVSDPCPNCSHMQTEVAKLNLIMTRHGLIDNKRTESKHSNRSAVSGEAMEPPILYEPSVYSPVPNARATEWEKTWARQPDDMTLQTHTRIPDKNASAEMKTLIREVGRLERELAMTRRELEAYKKSRAADTGSINQSINHSIAGSQISLRSNRDPPDTNRSSYEIRGNARWEDFGGSDIQEVAVRYETLFQEEWQQAYSAVKAAGLSLRDCYAFLQNILIESYKHNKRQTELQLQSFSRGANIFEKNNNAPVMSISEQAVLFRKSIAPQTISLLIKTFNRSNLKCLSEVESSIRNNKDIKIFIDKCLEITWYMCVQIPMMAIDNRFDLGIPFDRSKFKFHKIEGETFDYVVWPVLLSSEKGEVVQKGWADAKGISN